MFDNIIEEVRRSKPRVHCITNYVTANDCANILLACGASPIMADCPDESAEITAICKALVINLGTPSPQRLEAMLISGKKANEIGLPVIFDPVGAGASRFRTDFAEKLLKEVKLSIIRGNLSEIRSIAGTTSHSHGVDTADIVSDSSIVSCAALAEKFSAQTGAVIAVTGETDIVADSSSAYCIRNGHPIMGSITGCGCMLSALMGAFSAVSEDMLKAATAAVAAMDVCGETAAEHLLPYEGNAGCRNRMIDSVYRLSTEKMDTAARIEKL